MTESLERRVRHDPTEDDLAEGDQPLESGTPEEEDLDPAREAADLDQDPDAVPNRVDQATPPKSETISLPDDPKPDDDLYDETED